MCFLPAGCLLLRSTSDLHNNGLTGSLPTWANANTALTSLYAPARYPGPAAPPLLSTDPSTPAAPASRLVPNSLPRRRKARAKNRPLPRRTAPLFRPVSPAETSRRTPSPTARRSLSSPCSTTCACMGTHLSTHFPPHHPTHPTRRTALRRRLAPFLTALLRFRIPPPARRDLGDNSLSQAFPTVPTSITSLCVCRLVSLAPRRAASRLSGSLALTARHR